MIKLLIYLTFYTWNVAVGKVRFNTFDNKNCFKSLQLDKVCVCLLCRLVCTFCNTTNSERSFRVSRPKKRTKHWRCQFSTQRPISISCKSQINKLVNSYYIYIERERKKHYDEDLKGKRMKNKRSNTEELHRYFAIQLWRIS